MWYQLTNAAMGIFIMLIPALFGVTGSTAHNNFITGPLVFTFALAASTDAARNLRWVNVAGGAWLLLSTFLLSYAGSAVIVMIITALVVIALSIPQGEKSGEFGGGWRSLFQKDPLHIRAAREQ